jgi:adenylate cyclase
VGINTGVVYIGTVNLEGGRTDITCLGDTVNTTARLNSEAAAGEVLVGESAMAMSGLPKEAYENRKLTLKGKQETVEAWVVK